MATKTAPKTKAKPKATSAKKGSVAKDGATDTNADPTKKGKADKPIGVAPQSQLDLDEATKLEAAPQKKAAANTSPKKGPMPRSPRAGGS